MISIHKTLFNSLDKILNKADRLKYDQHFVTHESSDFTRKSRKLSFKDTIYCIQYAKRRDITIDQRNNS